MEWQAHEDWMQFGHTKARVYRVETEFLGRHIYFFTSRVGEMLLGGIPQQAHLPQRGVQHF